MKNLVLLLLLGLLTGLNGHDLNAQSGWQSATLTTTSGEEINGLLEDRRWQFRFSNLRFRETRKEKVRKIDLSEISSFRIGDRRYLVHDVTMNTPQQTRGKFEYQYVYKKTKARVTLLQLIEGPVSFYEYIDQQGNRHFFLQKGTENLEYLSYYYSPVAGLNNGKSFFWARTKLKGTLLRILGDCFRIQPEIKTIKYRREALISLIKNYYLCQSDTPDYIIGQKDGNWSIGPDVGMINTSPTYLKTDVPIYPFSGLNSWEPSFGGHVKYRFGGPRGAVALRFGAQYHQFDVTSSVPDIEEEDPSVDATFGYNYTERSVHLQLGAEFNLVRSRYPIFLESMAEYHRILNYRESRFSLRVANGQEEIEGLFFDFPNQGALNLSMGVGIIVGDARVSLRGSASRRKYPTYILNLYRLGVMGSYDF